MSKYTTIETIKSGKMQFNVKSGKDFRATMAKWHDADFDLAEKILFKNDRIDALKKLIKSNNDLIEKLERGESIISKKSIEDLRKEVEAWENDIESENNALSEYRKAQEERYKGARELLSKDLHKAYVNFVSNGNREAYVLALANFFDENGFEPTIDSINEFVAVVGKKKNSARQKVKTGKHNGEFAYGTWRDIFLGEICDVMGDALPLYKFTYVLKENREKKDA